jgi:hypothetical protein
MAITAMTGIERKYLYEIITGAAASADYCERLASLIRDIIERGRIAFRRHGRRDSRAPNGWEIVET